MKFTEIYANCRTQVVDTLESWWIKDQMTSEERDLMRSLIEDYVNTVNGDNIVIQSMYPWNATQGQEAEDAKNLVSPLWRMGYTPFVHQAEAWRYLLRDKKSVVVTTGTGSGKTECFLMPVIKDIASEAAKRAAQGDDSHPVEALFLYPLNALMTDQKERIDKYLYALDDFGEQLTFAVYNGNTPQEGFDTEAVVEARKLAESLSKTTYDEAVESGRQNCRRGVVHEQVSRDEIREVGSNILITNPSMLEYMLLRRKDQPIFARSKGKLRWIVIDETHTFTGAAAAELALLLRRVMLAFDVNPEDVRFITSSATISDDGGADLKKFIADLSGKADPDSIEVVSGKRSMCRSDIDPSGLVVNDMITLSVSDVRSIEDRLWDGGKDNYITLNALTDSGADVIEKLQILDALTSEDMKMRAKVHFFLPALNEGLKMPAAVVKELEGLPLFVCSECGHIIVGAQETAEGLIPLETKCETPDIFTASDDGDDVSDADADPSEVVETGERLISFVQDAAYAHQAVPYRITDGRLIIDRSGPYYVENSHRCPCCGKDKVKAGSRSVEGDSSSMLKSDFLRVINCPQNFLGRIIAPELLAQTTEISTSLPHKGQQYISFVDSRQGCSRATLDQNIEVETNWLYFKVFEALNNRSVEIGKIPQLQAEYNEYEQELQKPGMSDLARSALKAQLVSLQAEIDRRQNLKRYLYWDEVAELLMADPHFNLLYETYDTSRKSMVNGADDIRRVFPNGGTPQEVNQWKRRRYVYSVMYHALKRRPRMSNSPETTGMFHTYYPGLAQLTVPAEFIGVMSNEQWRDILKVYLDYDVRGHESMFYYSPDNDLIDVYDLDRYRYARTQRRPRNKPTSHSRIYRLVAQAFPSLSAEDVIRKMWDTLTGNSLMTVGKYLKPLKSLRGGQITGQRWTDFSTGGYYMNIADMAFVHYDQACLCPETGRTLDACVGHLTPYETEGRGFRRVEGPFTLDPYPVGSERPATMIEVRKWFDDKRRCLAHLWENKLAKYYLGPDIFIQREHTAQLSPTEARDYLIDFKEKHTINILACSTTMEMGVDVGPLELVVMNNVPPHASNYKQRAGRSGRMNQNRSASVALCGQDVHSRNVLTRPLSLINADIRAPYVDFRSEVILQRQINACIFRGMFGTIGFGDRGNEWGTKVIDFFTRFMWGERASGVAGKMFVDHTVVRRLPDYIPVHVSAYADDILNDVSCCAKLINEARNPGTAVIETVNDFLATLPAGIQVNVNDCFLKFAMALESMREEYRGTVLELARLFAEEVKRSNIDPNALYQNSDKFSWQVVNDRSFNKILRGLHFKWTDLLQTPLLEYFATHQFTPNANMPLDIIELIVSKQDKTKARGTGSNKQPSADLCRALSQFAPGRSVAINNSVYKVGGVDWSRPFMYYRRAEGGNLIIGNAADGFPVIFPDAFRTDYEVTRDTSQDVYSRVSAQFLEETVEQVEWRACVQQGQGDNPISYRISDMWTNTPYVLYYNDGQGDGFAVCQKCGRAVIDSDELGGEEENDSGQLEWVSRHRQLRWDPEKVDDAGNCDCCQSDIRRRVIFAGKLQTNFCDLKLYKPDNIRIAEMDVNVVEEDRKIMTTFAIVLCDAFAAEVQRDRSEIDFFISMAGTLCVFDTAKGGAGVSDQLSGEKLKRLIMTRISDMMKNVDEPYQILDRSTVRYYKDIDIPAFKQWLEWVKALILDEVPEEIRTQFGQSVVKANRTSLAEAIRNDAQSIIMFDTDIERYNYYDVDSESGWSVLAQKYAIPLDGHRQYYFYGQMPAIVSPVIRDMLVSLDGGRKRLYKADVSHFPYWPLAIAGGRLFFTDNRSWADMNDEWGTSVYSIPCPDIPCVAQGSLIVTDNLCPDARIVYLESGVEINADDLLQTLIDAEKAANAGNSLIERFIRDSHGKKLTVKYIDEHMKKHYGMLITLKFIRSLMICMPGCLVDSVKYVGEQYTDKFGKCTSFPHDPWEAYSNFVSSGERDIFLKNLARRSKVDLIVQSVGSRKLNHWRVLEISNGSNVLQIYPDGGFTTGWNVTSGSLTYYSDINTTFRMVTTERLKFDIAYM